MRKVQSPTVQVNVRAQGSAKVNVVINVREKKERKPLKFGKGNAKLDAAIFTFSLPAGYTCPFAEKCLAKADPDTGRIHAGPKAEIRCYAASIEARHSTPRRAHWHNLQALRACRNQQERVSLILESLSAFAGYVRVHDSGDYFSQDYFDAWLTVARERPRTLFYFYTKSLRYWVARMAEVGDGHSAGSLANVVPTASSGGKEDFLIELHGLRSARVVLSEEEAKTLKLEIDHDDSHAMKHGPNFALLIHGTQPAGTPAAKALAALRAQGEYGYGQKADAARVRSGRLPLAVV